MRTPELGVTTEVEFCEPLVRTRMFYNQTHNLFRSFRALRLFPSDINGAKSSAGRFRGAGKIGASSW